MIHSFSNQVLILTEDRSNLLYHFIFKLSGDLLFNSWTKQGLCLCLFDQRYSHSRTKGHHQDSTAPRQRIYRVLFEVLGLIKHQNLSESSKWGNNLFSMEFSSILVFSKLQMFLQGPGPKSKNRREYSECSRGFICPKEQILKQGTWVSSGVGGSH